MKSIATEPLKMDTDVSTLLLDKALILTEFHLFPNLPEEIRLMIWEEHWGSAEEKAHVKISPKYKYITSTRVPPCLRPNIIVQFCADSVYDRTSTLFVCKESREMTKKRFPNYMRMHPAGNQIRFNAERDTIVLDAASAFQLFIFNRTQRPFGDFLVGFDKVKEVEITEQFSEPGHVGGQALLTSIFTGVKAFKKGPATVRHRTLVRSLRELRQQMVRFKLGKNQAGVVLQAGGNITRHWSDFPTRA